MRVAANRANGMPRSGSKAWAACDQRGQPGGGEVVAVDVGGHPAEHLADDVTDQRHVGGDQLLDSAPGPRDVVLGGGHSG